MQALLSPKALRLHVFWLIGRILSKINCKTQIEEGLLGHLLRRGLVPAEGQDIPVDIGEIPPVDLLKIRHRFTSSLFVTHKTAVLLFRYNSLFKFPENDYNENITSMKGEPPWRT